MAFGGVRLKRQGEGGCTVLAAGARVACADPTSTIDPVGPNDAGLAAGSPGPSGAGMLGHANVLISLDTCRQGISGLGDAAAGRRPSGRGSERNDLIGVDQEQHPNLVGLSE